MALFQKKPQVSSSIPLYTLGIEQTYLIVGLGNQGKKYIGTRHNVGFACVDAFAEANGFPAWTEKKDFSAQLTSQLMGNVRIILAKPTTYMNLSGRAVAAICQFYKIPPQQTIVVQDELDIPFGELRSKSGGGAAGHKGVLSIIEAIGSDFKRIRIGIRNELAEKADGADFVLGKFNKDEQQHLKALTREASALLSEYIYGDMTTTAQSRSFIT